MAFCYLPSARERGEDPRTLLWIRFALHGFPCQPPCCREAYPSLAAARALPVICWLWMSCEKEGRGLIHFPSFSIGDSSLIRLYLELPKKWMVPLVTSNLNNKDVPSVECQAFYFTLTVDLWSCLYEGRNQGTLRCGTAWDVLGVILQRLRIWTACLSLLVTYWLSHQ